MHRPVPTLTIRQRSSTVPASEQPSAYAIAAMGSPAQGMATRGKAKQRAFAPRSGHPVLCPGMLPCKHPSAAWCARNMAFPPWPLVSSRNLSGIWRSYPISGSAFLNQAMRPIATGSGAAGSQGRSPAGSRRIAPTQTRSGAAGTAAHNVMPRQDARCLGGDKLRLLPALRHLRDSVTASKPFLRIVGKYQGQ